MSDWLFSEIDFDMTVVTSEKDFTNDDIAIEFLKYFIKHTDAKSNSEWKLLLMNNHESHETDEFLQLTNDNYISSYFLISHFTHYMQSLNVDVFQSYKHWHEVAMQDALASVGEKPPTRTSPSLSMMNWISVWMHIYEYM